MMSSVMDQIRLDVNLRWHCRKSWPLLRRQSQRLGLLKIAVKRGLFGGSWLMSKVTLSICKSRIQDPDVNKGVSLGCQKLNAWLDGFSLLMTVDGALEQTMTEWWIVKAAVISYFYNQSEANDCMCRFSSLQSSLSLISSLLWFLIQLYLPSHQWCFQNNTQVTINPLHALIQLTAKTGS